MQALGNDYAVIDCTETEIARPADLAKIITDRRLGVGADGMLMICPSRAADFRMRIFNADGSEAEMCGNGIRCAAKFAYERRHVPSRGAFTAPGTAETFAESLLVETGKGSLEVGLACRPNGTIESICVNMGRPVLDPSLIPVNLPGESVIQRPIAIEGLQLRMSCVSMGNPHAVFFHDDPESVDLERLGPKVERHVLFPNRTNVHFVRASGRDELLIATWERGSGRTMACGTGASAACVAAYLAGLSNRAVTAHLPGGDLRVLWNERDGCVYITGPAEDVFTGEFAAGDGFVRPWKD